MADRIANLAEQQGGKILPEATAAALHKKLTDQVPMGVQVGSIVVTNGGKPYFDTWKAACGDGCRYDFIPLHYYGLTSAGFISYIKVSYIDFCLYRTHANLIRNMRMKVNRSGLQRCVSLSLNNVRH